MRRRAGRPQLRGLGPSARPSLRPYDLELDSAALEEEGERGRGQQAQGPVPLRRPDGRSGEVLWLAGVPATGAEKRGPFGLQSIWG